MSEYKCHWPDCGFHVGIVGQCITEEDFEQQDYYFEEIEQHVQRHEEELRMGPGRRLKELRESKKLEQGQLAARMWNLGLPWSRATLSKVERGQREIRLHEVPVICMALDLEKIQDFWQPGTIPVRKRLTAVEALAEIQVIIEQLDSMAKEVPSAVAAAEGDETENPEQ